MKLHLIIIIIILFSCIGFADWQNIQGSDAFAYTFEVDQASNSLVTCLAVGGIWRTANGGVQWEPINWRIFSEPYLQYPYCGARKIDFLDAEGDTIFLSCIEQENGGVFNGSTVYISIDHGDSWDRIDENFGSGSNEEFIIADKFNHNTLYFLGSHHFRMSYNFGATWGSFVIENDYSPKHGLYQLNDSSLVFSSSYSHSGEIGIGGLGRSVNGGQDWDYLVDFYDLWGVNYASVGDFDVLSNGDWIAPVTWTLPINWETMNIIISSDQGETWERFGGGLPPRFDPIRIIEDPLLEGRLYIIGNQKYGVYVSDDYGRNWSRLLNGLPENVSVCGDLKANRFNGDILVSIDSYGIYKSSDHGQSWQTIPLPPMGTQGFISCFPDNVFYRDYGYRLWKLEEPSETLEEIFYPFTEDTLTMLRPIAYQNGDTLVSGVWKRPFTNPTDHFQMAYSYDDGINWEYSDFLDFLPDVYFKVFSNQNLTRFITLNPMRDSLYLSYDLGVTWDAIYLFDPIKSVVQDETNIYLSSMNQVYRLDEAHEELISLNYEGAEIDRFFALIDNKVFIKDYSYPISNCYCYSNNHWEMRGEIPVFTSKCVSFLNEGEIVLVAVKSYENKIWISFDEGWNWEEKTIDFPFQGQTWAFFDFVYDPHRELIWASTGAGLCYLNIDELSVGQKTVTFLAPRFHGYRSFPQPLQSRDRVDLHHSLIRRSNPHHLRHTGQGSINTSKRFPTRRFS